MPGAKASAAGRPFARKGFLGQSSFVLPWFVMLIVQAFSSRRKVNEPKSLLPMEKKLQFVQDDKP